MSHRHHTYPKKETPYLFDARESPSEALSIVPKSKSPQEELADFFAASNRKETIPPKGSLECFFQKAQKTKSSESTSGRQERLIPFHHEVSLSNTSVRKRSINQSEAESSRDSSVGSSGDASEVACDVCTCLNKLSASGKWIPCEACGNLIKPMFAHAEAKKRRTTSVQTKNSTRKGCTRSTDLVMSWTCNTCTLSNSSARSTSGWYACDACDQPFVSGELSDNSGSKTDALFETPVFNRKLPPRNSVTLSTGKSAPPPRPGQMSFPCDVIVIDDDDDVYDTSLHCQNSTCDRSNLYEIHAGDTMKPFIKSNDSSPATIVLDNANGDVNENAKTKASVATVTDHVLTLSVSQHSGRFTIHLAENGMSTLVNFDMDDVLTDESSDFLLDARIKKASFECRDLKIKFDRKGVLKILRKAELHTLDLPKRQMEDDLKMFISSYLRLREIEKKTLQKSGEAIAATDLSYMVARLLVAPVGGTERYVGGAKEHANHNLAKGTASENDLSVLDGRCCAWCGSCLSAVSIRAESTYCSQDCAEEGRLRRGGKFASVNIRRSVFALEGGKCTLCHIDAHALYEQIRSLQPAERLNKLLAVNWRLPISGRAMEHLLQDPKEGDFWQADHIRAVKEGGGDSGMENLRTLCVPCHSRETTKLRTRLQLHGQYVPANGQMVVLFK
jgi:5-methylcytosine-specific restriction endonuclease McrA